jgi:hypothetical protein
MAPNPNIYAALLQGTNLNYSQAMVWEERVKTCHTYAKFGRRYRQRVRFLLAKDKGEFTLFQNSYQREYYMLPQWERIGGDNEPVEPQASETYKKNLTFDYNTWSSSDDDGTLLGYDGSGRTLFCEHRKSGKQVHSNQMVIPGSNELKFIEKFSDQKDDEGRIYCTFDPVKKFYYDEDLDDDDDPYLTLSIQRRLERKKRRERLVEGEQKHFRV